MTAPRPLSIWEQAHMVDQLVARCVMADGDIAGSATLTIDKETAENLHHLAMRLQRLAPHEERIKRMVMGG